MIQLRYYYNQVQPEYYENRMHAMIGNCVMSDIACVGCLVNVLMKGKLTGEINRREQGAA